MAEGTADIHFFQVYGDNLSECFKFCDMMKQYGSKFGLDYKNERGPVDMPLFIFEHNGLDIGFLPCGKYTNWSQNRRPSLGKEDSDIILCHSEDTKSSGNPILAIEFNDAKSVGNNDWQRFPRISQAAESGVPYIYTVPVVTKDNQGRDRTPNSIVQFAQFALMGKYKSPSITLFRRSVWYEGAKKRGNVSENMNMNTAYGETIAKTTLSYILSAIAGRNHKSVKKKAQSLREQALSEALENMLIWMRDHVEEEVTVFKNSNIIAENIDSVRNLWLRVIENGTEVSKKHRFYEISEDDIINNSVPFFKDARTNNENTDFGEINSKMKFLDSYNKKDVEKFMKFWGISTSDTKPKRDEIFNGESVKKVPVASRQGKNQFAFIYNTEKLSTLLNKYYNLNKGITERIESVEGPIIIYPCAGYTKGEVTRRPDKGYPPLLHELFVDCSPVELVVAILYSEHVPEEWQEKIKIAEKEDEKKDSTNNLLRNLEQYCDIIIADKYTGNDSQVGGTYEGSN